MDTTQFQKQIEMIRSDSADSSILDVYSSSVTNTVEFVDSSMGNTSFYYKLFYEIPNKAT
jgi:hypothetical protein